MSAAMSIAMSIEGSLSDYPLLDVIAILAKREESGRLQIDFPSVQGALYFVKGELAAAQVGNVTGFSAANLALSMEGIRFRFDPFVEIPATHFGDPNERLLLNRLLRIQTAGADTFQEQGDTGESSTIVITPRPLATPAPIPKAAATKAIREPPSVRFDSLGTLMKQLGTLISQSAAYMKQPKISVKAASILLLGILLAIAIAGLRSKANEPASLRMSREATAPVSSGSTEAPRNAQGQETSVSLTVNPNAARSAAKPSIQENRRASHAEIADSSQTIAAHRRKAMPIEPVEQETSAEDRRTPKTLFREVPVVVRIEDGHVAEAYVKNRRAGGEAFEATALRLARQRRYPKDRRGVETVVFRVTSEP